MWSILSQAWSITYLASTQAEGTEILGLIRGFSRWIAVSSVVDTYIMSGRRYRDSVRHQHNRFKNHVHADDGKSLGGFDNVAAPAYVSFD